MDDGDEGIAAYLGTVVMQFYEALIRADGEKAASFVVPEKRQSGALSADRITKFHSAFQQPMQLDEVTQVGANTVSVKYHYWSESDRQCSGLATVTTENRNGENLIQSIAANEKCV